jgi:hypothetical protein
MATAIFASPRAGNELKAPRKLLARGVAAVAIAVFWCLSALGTTVGTTVGVTTLTGAVTAASSTPAEAYYGRRWYRGRRRWRRGWRY